MRSKKNDISKNKTGEWNEKKREREKMDGTVLVSYKKIPGRDKKKKKYLYTSNDRILTLLILNDD